MPIILKSKREIEMMRRAGRLAHDIIEKMKAATVEGVTTGELDAIAAREMESARAVSMSRFYPKYEPGTGFPGYTCVSVNEEVVHGVPGERRLKEGDVVKLDVALSLDGYCADTATTVGIGRLAPRVQQLLDVTWKTFQLAIESMAINRKWSEVARLMQRNVETYGFAVVREFVGHGVGRSMHEAPKVPNFWTAEQLREDFKLMPGTTIAVEPMVAMGKREVNVRADAWTMVTNDGQPAAHFEHTVAMTTAGPVILTNGSDHPGTGT